MKKVFFALVASAFCLNVMAVKTANVVIVLSSESGTSDYVTFTEDDTFSNEVYNDVDGDAVKLFSTGVSKTVLAWTNAPYKDSLSAVAMKNFEDMPFVVKTNKVDNNYKLKFMYVSGRELKLLDKVTGTEVTIADNGEYNFTADMNQVLADRFVLAPHAVPTEFKVCHQYGKIIVDNPETTAMDVVLDGEKIGEAAAQTFASEVTVTAAAGQHTLEINGQTLIISVQ